MFASSQLISLPLCQIFSVFFRLMCPLQAKSITPALRQGYGGQGSDRPRPMNFVAKGRSCAHPPPGFFVSVHSKGTLSRSFVQVFIPRWLQAIFLEVFIAKGV